MLVVDFLELDCDVPKDVAELFGGVFHVLVVGLVAPSDFALVSGDAFFVDEREEVHEAFGATGVEEIETYLDIDWSVVFVDEFFYGRIELDRILHVGASGDGEIAVLERDCRCPIGTWDQGVHFESFFVVEYFRQLVFVVFGDWRRRGVLPASL